MPLSPSIRQVADLHINQPLQQVSLAWKQGNDAFIADKVFPTVNVAKQSDLIYIWPKGTLFRENVAVRAPGAEPPRTSWKTTKTSYVTEIFELAEDIFDEERANADSEFELDATAATQLTQNHLLFREKSWAQKFFTTGVWNTDYTGIPAGVPAANQFLQWDAAGSDPIVQMQTDVIRMQEQTGIRPNFLLMTPYIELALSSHPLVIDRVKYTGVATALNIQFPGAGTKAWRMMLAEMFNVPNIYVASAVYNASNAVYDDAPEADPANPAGMQFLFGKDMMLGYAAPNPGKKVPTAGYTFSWTGYTGSGGIRFIKDRNTIRRCDTIVAEQAFSHQVMAPDLCFFYSGVVGP